MPAFNLPFMKKPAQGDSGQAGNQASQKNSAAQPQAASASPPPTEDEIRLKVYRLIIDRYRDKIEEYETKSVSDLKLLVQPRNERVAAMRESLTWSFHPYVYEEHFLQAAKMAFEYVSSFRTLSLPVSFWLDFSEMQQMMAGDEIDKSILFCSLLRALGSDSAKVVVTDSRNSHVLFGFSGKFFIADHMQKELLEKASEEEAKACLKGKPLYSFNDKDYEDFQETE